MRTLFSFVLCALLAMTCWAETTPAITNKDMLQAAIRQVTQLKITKQTDSLFYSPTTGIEDCCSWSALECFNSQLLNIPTSNKDLQAKLHKNLRKKVIVSSVDRCTVEQKSKVKCQSCNSYPMIDSHEFMKNLLSLLQKSFMQLP
ncbi:interleukin-21 [Pygocentrus nattereri]|uniref:interleukin-21 n=1 Tax=Pygocentrus nattereri TaxID=42514 RepID=UPI0008149347|nr:interleukin-21 [Pygocentrus nattereri]